MEPAASNSRRAEAVRRLLWFALGIIGVSLLLSWAAHFWIHLSRWKIFRRCVSIAAAFMLCILLRRIHGLSLRSLGLGPWKQGRRQLLQGVVLGFSIVLVVAAGYLFTDVVRIAIHSDTVRLILSLGISLPLMLLVAVLEELVFRGYVLQELLSWSKPFAIFSSSAVYAVVHLKTTIEWPASAFEIVGLFVLGWVLAISTLRTKQLYLAIGLHGSMAYCARVNKLLVDFYLPSMQWLIGTSRLVNGIVPWVMLLALGFFLMHRFRDAESCPIDAPHQSSQALLRHPPMGDPFRESSKGPIHS